MLANPFRLKLRGSSAVAYGEKAVIGAASAVADIGSPNPVKPLAVVRLPEDAGGGELTIEYRVNTVEDRGVKPAVVVHSIGLRALGTPEGGGQWHEVDPIWYEGAIQPVTGRRLPVYRSVVIVEAEH